MLSAKLSGRNTYIGVRRQYAAQECLLTGFGTHQVMEHCFGIPGRMSVAFFQFAFALGGCVLEWKSPDNHPRLTPG